MITRNVDNTADDHLILRKMREQILRCAYQAKEGHIASGFSILNLLWVLYDKVMNIDPGNPEDAGRDRFILSKGHASLGIYAVLAEKGFFPQEELDRFGSYESILGGHPDRNKVPGIEASTGSLGHGFPIAVGRALALKTRGSGSQVYCLIGDGEANEGSVWESMLLAAHRELNNLCCLFDFNHSTDRALGLGDPVAKFQSFGWDVLEVPGHDNAAIERALTEARNELPRMIVAHTTKGYGCIEMESDPSWHHRSPASEEELNRLVEALR